MYLPTHILAIDENAVGKVLVFGVFALIWLVSQVASVLAKKAEEQKRKRMLQMQNAPQPPAPMQRSVRPSASPRPMTRPMRAPQTPKPQRVKTKAPPPLPKKRTSATPFATKSAAPTPPTPTPAQNLELSPKRQIAATAQTLHTWLRPATLRQQFILTEVLQPPLGLRDPDSSRML